MGNTVYFAFDSSALTADTEGTLMRQAAFLNANPALMVTIEGHCDERGTREYNLALGERRATAARDYLLAQGVDSARIRTISYGKERPAVAGSNESAWAKNRRAATVIN
ncbi:MAG: peptidoglycan-associated lipoprotein Pal [Rhodobiaceae bacterium]